MTTFERFQPALFEFLEQLAASRPFMRFLCDALKVPF